ncbi:MAG: prepilin-type N-terminal cleavage/methylation domain-containing protein [Gammaproteobacteria bacterium]|nr:prepilin-type N-terminal cleavage/methylation domain-containing protein [Gammaproteobacteria bacterium]
MRNKTKKSNRAFSLLELLITMTIIGILTGIGYPTYKNHITRTRRAQATVMLTNIAAQMEHYYNQHHTYQGATLKTLRINNDASYYDFVITNTNEDAFLIKAIPRGVQAANDTDCGILSIDQQGYKNGSVENNFADRQKT